MKLIAHRGFWRTPDEKNTEAAFRRALDAGFGIETDFRDLDGALVVSHDPPRQGALPASAFFDLVRAYSSGVIAINVKADGLQALLAQATAGLPRDRGFVFDMSVPDTLRHFDQELPVFVRVSEFESPGAPLLARASGVWLDAFSGDWYSRQTIADYRKLGLAVCLVSPELHRRPHEDLWQRLKEWGLAADEGFHLCTDFPDRAKAYFHD